MSGTSQSSAIITESAESEVSQLQKVFRTVKESSIACDVDAPSVCTPQVKKTVYDDTVFTTVCGRPYRSQDSKVQVENEDRNLPDEIKFFDAKEKDLYLSRANSDKIPITCKSNHAFLYKDRLGSGKKGKCIQFEDNWFTPSEFENLSGLEMSKDWKRSLRYGGRSMQALINQGLLRPHAATCMCGVCCDDETVTGPIRFYTPKIRRKRSATTSFPTTPYAFADDRYRPSTAPANTHKHCFTLIAQNPAQGQTIGCDLPPDSVDHLKVKLSACYPLSSKTRKLLDALSEMETDDRKVWERLDKKADSMMESFEQLREVIIETKKQCIERRSTLIRDFIEILDRQQTNFDAASTFSMQKSFKVGEKFDDDGQDEDGTEICRACGRPANSECTGCRKATYCSTECQEKDWNSGHRDVCRGLACQEMSSGGGDVLPI